MNNPQDIEYRRVFVGTHHRTGMDLRPCGIIIRRNMYKVLMIIALFAFACGYTLATDEGVCCRRACMVDWTCMDEFGGVHSGLTSLCNNVGTDGEPCPPDCNPPPPPGYAVCMATSTVDCWDNHYPCAKKVER